MAIVPVGVWRGLVRSLVAPGLDPDLPVTEQRRRIAFATRLLPRPRGVRLVPSAQGDPHGEWHRPPGAGPEHAILYLHGGGFVVGSPRTHRALASALAMAARAPVFVLDYRLAPEFPYPAALDDAMAAWEWLNTRVPGVHRPAIAGDSAGGNLAIGVALEAARLGSPAAALGLFSPWLDLSCQRSASPDAPADLMLSSAWMRACARLYLAGGDVSEPRVSPAHADLADLPPTLLQSTNSERLAPEIEVFVERARAAGADLRADVWPDLWHAWQGLGQALEPARAALDEAGRFLAAAMSRQGQVSQESAPNRVGGG